MSHVRIRKSLCPRMLTNTCCTDPDTANSTGSTIRSPDYVPVSPTHSFCSWNEWVPPGTGSGQGTEAIRVRRPTILGYLKKPLSMTSEVMDSNFPLSDTADIANDR